MKLVFFVETMGQVGGGDYSILKFAEYLAKKGHKVTLFCGRYPVVFKNGLPKTMKIFTRGKLQRLLPGMGRLDRAWARLRYHWFYLTHLKNKNIDFLIGHQTLSSIMCSKYAKLLGIPSVQFVFESPHWLFKEMSTIWLEESKGLILEEWQGFEKALKDSDIIFANSGITAEECGKWIGRNDIKVIRPGFEAKEQALANVVNRKQVLYLGRLDTNKNVADIIQAVRNLPVELKIAGGGYLRPELEALAKKLNSPTEFLGFVDEDTKWKLLSGSAVVVFPSSFEGFGMPPMEAFSVGRPCICSDIPVLREAYDGIADFVKVHDVKGLSSLIKNYINNPTMADKKGANGKKYVLKTFSWKTSVEKIEQVLSR